ncbi:unnamed protein product, partial [Oikopleura dioica]
LKKFQIRRLQMLTEKSIFFYCKGVFQNLHWR